jgi:peptidoglycan biosynthesis protein MviN/MurJ (putative lipid II flippase)
MLGLLNRRLGGLRGHGMLRLLSKVLAASAGMGLASWLVAETLRHSLLPASLWAELTVVGGATVIGLAVYVALMALLRADSGGLVRGLLERRHPSSTS